MVQFNLYLLAFGLLFLLLFFFILFFIIFFIIFIFIIFSYQNVEDKFTQIGKAVVDAPM